MDSQDACRDACRGESQAACPEAGTLGETLEAEAAASLRSLGRGISLQLVKVRAAPGSPGEPGPAPSLPGTLVVAESRPRTRPSRRVIQACVDPPLSRAQDGVVW